MKLGQARNKVIQSNRQQKALLERFTKQQQRKRDEKAKDAKNGR
jgi:hypothetical protein